jgi:hypothetical protein
MDATNAGVNFIDIADDERPLVWFFKGWFAFCLFGPFSKETYCITLLVATATKTDNNKQNGRWQIVLF